MRDVIDAEEIRLDRWTVVFHPEDKTIDTSTIDNTSTGGGGGGGANTNYNTSSSGGGANTGSGGGSVPGSNMLTKQVINTTGKKRQKLYKIKVTNENIRKLAGQSQNIIQHILNTIF